MEGESFLVESRERLVEEKNPLALLDEGAGTSPRVKKLGSKRSRRHTHNADGSTSAAIWI